MSIFQNEFLKMDNFIKCSLIFLGNKIQSQLCKFEQIKFKYIREIIFIHISFAIKIFPNCCEITAKIPDWNMVPSSLILTVEKKNPGYLLSSLVNGNLYQRHIILLSRNVLIAKALTRLGWPMIHQYISFYQRYIILTVSIIHR